MGLYGGLSQALEYNDRLQAQDEDRAFREQVRQDGLAQLEQDNLYRQEAIQQRQQQIDNRKEYLNNNLEMDKQLFGLKNKIADTNAKRYHEANKIKMAKQFHDAQKEKIKSQQMPQQLASNYANMIHAGSDKDTAIGMLNRHSPIPIIDIQNDSMGDSIVLLGNGKKWKWRKSTLDGMVKKKKPAIDKNVKLRQGVLESNIKKLEGVITFNNYLLQSGTDEEGSQLTDAKRKQLENKVKILRKQVDGMYNDFDNQDPMTADTPPPPAVKKVKTGALSTEPALSTGVKTQPTNKDARIDKTKQEILNVLTSNKSSKEDKAQARRALNLINNNMALGVFKRLDNKLKGGVNGK